MKNDCCNCLREKQECLPFIDRFSENNHQSNQCACNHTCYDSSNQMQNQKDDSFYNWTDYYNSFPPLIPPPLPCPSVTCPTCPSLTCPTCPTPTCPACPTPTCPACPSLTCPTLPTAVGIYTFNPDPQQSSTAVTTVDLGTAVYTEGTGIALTAPDTITITEPGIYKMYFGADLLLNEATDQLILAAALNNDVLPGSSISDTESAAGNLVSFRNTVYLYNSTTSTVNLVDVATSNLDSIATVTVTIYKVQ